VSATIRDLDGRFGTQPSHVLTRLYTRAIAEAGGIPLVVPAEQPGDVHEVLDRVDAIVLSGGGDIDPAEHGHNQNELIDDVVPDRDRFELEMARGVRERGMPLLAICRGLQIVNVALGGDLILDIPSEVGTRVVHRSPTYGIVARHRIAIAASSRLADLLGTARTTVNSSHHQAVRTPGEGLTPVSWAEDGVIEAIESTDAAWPLCAIQWHPELREPDSAVARRPFEAVVDAARAALRR
jgi:putative glutamine amidotransferase